MSRTCAQHQPLCLDLSADYRVDVYSRTGSVLAFVSPDKVDLIALRIPAGARSRLPFIGLGVGAYIDHDLRRGRAQIA